MEKVINKQQYADILHAPEGILAATSDTFPAFRSASSIHITHIPMPF